MKLVRIISVIGFYVTRLAAFAYLITALYVLLSVLLKLPGYEMPEHNKFSINYPFSNKHFLNGSENTAAYIFEMVALIFFYGVFFLLLGNVFKTFEQKKLFTSQGVSHLKRFYILNLFICPVLFVILMILSHEDISYPILLIAHIVIGIFSLFLVAIFNQGLKLQNDQDLYI